MPILLTSKKSIICAAIGFCSFSMVSLANAMVHENASPIPTGTYIGGFGGWGAANNFGVTQSGIAIYPPGSSLGFPLPVVAQGSVNTSSIGFGGLHFGYEWARPYSECAWNINPGIELEGFYFSITNNAQIFNANPRLADHRFKDSFPMDTGVVLVNGMLGFDNPAISTVVHPYIGAGLGAAIISISGANSTQINPPEADINHFNSSTSGLDWTFAAQVKAGLRFVINENWRVFAEYRFTYIGNTDYTFGSTRYPTHVETSSWVVNIDNMYYNSGALGIEFTM